jgi:hypothetical protein
VPAHRRLTAPAHITLVYPFTGGAHENIVMVGGRGRRVAIVLVLLALAAWGGAAARRR